MTDPNMTLLPAQSISLLDIYTKQIELLADIKQLKEMLPDHEARIRKLEAWRYGLPVASVLAAGSVALSTYGLLKP